MITTTLFKAADAAIETLVLTTSDHDSMMKEMGIGPMALERTAARILDDFSDEPEAMVLQGLLLGIMTERLFTRMAHATKSGSDDAIFDTIKMLAQSFPHTSEEEAGRDFISDLADTLYVLYDVNLPEETTGEEVLKAMQEKLAENPEGQQSAQTIGDLLAQSAAVPE